MAKRSSTNSCSSFSPLIQWRLSESAIERSSSLELKAPALVNDGTGTNRLSRT